MNRPSIERIGAIHNELHTAFGKKRYVSSTKVAERLECSVKTVRRDIEFMRDRLALPIEYDQQNHGYYYTREVPALPMIQINEGELFSLLIATKAISAYQGTPFEEPLKHAFDKLAQSLPNKSVDIHLDDWNRAIGFQTAPLPTIQLKIFNELTKATIHKKQIRINYKTPDKPAAERVVDPIHLTNIRGEWYLIAWCHTRKEVRKFNVLRIRELTPTGKNCDDHSDFALRDYLGKSFGIYAGKEGYKIVLHIDKSIADYFRERNWHNSQQIYELEDGHLRVTYNLNSLIEIHRWILSWGGLIRVEEPSELARMVLESAEKLLKK